jgi:hypothetical protein
VMDPSADDFSQPGSGGDPNRDAVAPSTPSASDASTSPADRRAGGPDPAEGAPLTPPAEPEADDWDVPECEIPGEGPFRQGLWLTAAAWLPPELLSPGSPAPGATGSAGLAGFGQGGVLDQLSPGPVLANFLAGKAGGLAGTGVTPPPADAAPANDLTSPAGSPRPPETASPTSCPPSKLAGLTDDELTGMIVARR